MRLAILTLNDYGQRIAEKIDAHKQYECQIWRGKGGLATFGELVANIYEDFDGLVFIMASGIAVRSIAPLLKDKSSDPAIVVIDPAGQFVISLLAGHLGGANQLAKNIAGMLQAQPVITTATDVFGKRSLEEWAAYFNLGIKNIQGLVKINSALLNNREIMIYSALEPNYFRQYPLTEAKKMSFYPLQALKDSKSAAKSISIGISSSGGLGTRVDLELIIRNLVVGLGCRRGTSVDNLSQFLKEVLVAEGLKMANVQKLVSVDLKKDEEGLLTLARNLKIPLEFYSSCDLAQVFHKHPNLEYSSFVQKTIGVGGVCEPAALLGSRQGKLIVRKQSREGMTLAIVEEKLPLWV